MKYNIFFEKQGIGNGLFPRRQAENSPAKIC